VGDSGGGLKNVISWRCKLEVICCDNGPERITAAIQASAQEWVIRSVIFGLKTGIFAINTSSCISQLNQPQL
jgi:hypothetical protein